jgi:hypothetical protein
MKSGISRLHFTVLKQGSLLSCHPHWALAVRLVGQPCHMFCTVGTERESGIRQEVTFCCGTRETDWQNRNVHYHLDKSLHMCSIVININPSYSVTYCSLRCFLILSYSAHFDFLSGSFHKAYRKVTCSSRLSHACCTFRQSLLITWTYFLYLGQFLRSWWSPNATVQSVAPLYVRPSVCNPVSVTKPFVEYLRNSPPAFLKKAVEQKFLKFLYILACGSHGSGTLRTRFDTAAVQQFQCKATRYLVAPVGRVLCSRT